MKVAKKAFAVITSLSTIFMVTPCFAGTEFLSYEGRNAVHEGQGGNKKVVDGIDFWMTGAPPHRFQVLGSISDRRHETGVFGMVRMASMDSDIAHTAKAAGGDAVILSDQSEEFLGATAFSNTNINGSVNGNEFSANAFSSSLARPIKNHLSSYVVVKYLSDEVAPPVSQHEVRPSYGNQ